MFSRRFLQVGVWAFAAAALALSAQAASFSAANVKGNYSFLVNKWTVDITVQQFAMVGVLTFDGAGNVTGSATAVGGGVTLSGALGGTYTVNSNGTGVIGLTTLFVGGTAQVAITLTSTSAGVSHGLLLLQTDAGSNEVISGTAVLQSLTPAAYSAATVHGSFSLQTNAWGADVNLPAEGGIGIVTFDGKGKLKGSLTDVYAGVPNSLTLTGTYTVNPDGSCTASLRLSNSATPKYACALNSVGAGGATGFQLLLSNPLPRGTANSANWINSGTAVKQGNP